MSIIRIGQSHYAPEIDEEKCVRILSSERTPDVLVLKFHSDMPLLGVKDRGIKWIQRSQPAYDTVRWGEVEGWTCVIPCRKLEEQTEDAQFVFMDEAEKRFFVDWENGSPECPCRVRLMDLQ